MGEPRRDVHEEHDQRTKEALAHTVRRHMAMRHGYSRVLALVFCAASCVATAGGGAAAEPPLDADSFLRAGTASQGAGDHAEAERSLRRGLALAPDDPALRSALGRTLFETGRPAEAVTEYGRALAAAPDDARTHHDLARALRAIGDLAGAGRHFARSLAIEPRCEVHADFGLLQDLLGREDLARQSYEKGFALDATCPAARMNLASMLIEDGEYEEAAVHFRKAIEGKPSAEAHSGLGYALNQLGRLDEAAAEHEKAVALDPAAAEVHRNRALTQARLRKYEEAIASYRRAIAIEPRVSTYYSLAGVLRAAGRPDEAQAEYRRGQELSRRQQEQSPSSAAPGPSPHATGGRAGPSE